ncbi:ligand-binding sensor domain-containing protein [Inmirania thermothiophila]|uniref:Two component regulator with propeller domain n=1 Tax=Inmirania thermothiophila TaxID=1750597 RepID=A0A3N1Y234_9GAMM|nr:two-component regulator propeller domain-containing protein [Inmirania thermothiophila]ROR32903.1 two component regulator with propeller domain [Inmirania thermothiophila]
MSTRQWIAVAALAAALTACDRADEARDRAGARPDVPQAAVTPAPAAPPQAPEAAPPQPPPAPAPKAQAGAAGGDGAEARRRYRVADRFEVGPGVYVRALAYDPGADALWVGTSAGVLEVGLDDYRVRNTFTRKDGLANEYVFAIAVDRDGNKWFGTNAGGVSRYRDGQWKVFFPMHGLADYWVYSFAQQRSGDIWIGTWAGVNRYDPRTGRLTTYVKELVNEWVYGIAVDSKDRVWFGTEGGVSMYDGRAWYEWTHDDGLGAPNEAGLPPSTNTGLGTRQRHNLGVLSGTGPTYNPNYVFSIIAARDDTIWAGTWGGGVSRFDGRRWTNYTRKDGLAGNIVYAVAQAPDGALWFGTDAGLSRFDGRDWESFNPHHGLTGRDVYAVVATPDGSIWAGTRGGVTRLVRDEASEGR